MMWALNTLETILFSDIEKSDDIVPNSYHNRVFAGKK